MSRLEFPSFGGIAIGTKLGNWPLFKIELKLQLRVLS
jgi:hypothetical protein